MIPDELIKLINISRTFNPVVSFDKNFITSIVQTAAISISANSANQVDLTEGLISIDGDSANAITIDPTWVNTNSGKVPDNTKRNLIAVQLINGYFYYSVIFATLPNTVGPSLVSAQTSGYGDVVKLKYNQAIYGTPNYTITGKTITSQTITNDTVFVKITVPFTNGQSIFVSGGGIQDSLSHSCANLTNYPTTNNTATFTNLRSLSTLTSNQIQLTKPGAYKLFFSNGTIDFDFSLAFDFYFVSSGAFRGIMENGAFQLQIGTSGQIQLTLLSTTGNRDIYTNSPLTAGVWYRMVFTYKAGQATKIFANGTQQSANASYPGDVYTKMAAPSISQQFYIGGNNYFGSMNTCLMDNLIIVSKELTTTEITEDYNLVGGVYTPVDPQTRSFASFIEANYRFEGNSLDFGKNSYDLSSPVTPTYSTSHP